MIPVKLALASVAMLFAFGAGWVSNGWRLTSAINFEHIKEMQSAQALKEKAESERDVLASKLKASDDSHAAQLQKVQDETNRLRDRVSTGPVRLLVAAKCPAAPIVSEAASSPSMDSGAGAELDSTARTAYFQLRDGIDRVEAKLAACQGELRLRDESDKTRLDPPQ